MNRYGVRTRLLSAMPSDRGSRALDLGEGEAASWTHCHARRVGVIVSLDRTKMGWAAMSSNYWPIADRGVFEFENSFYLRSDPYRIGKLLGQYEVSKQIVGLPGSVVESGVYKGVSFVRRATFRHLLETQEARKLIGFDAFGNSPELGLCRAADIEFAATHDEIAGGAGILLLDLSDLVEAKAFGHFDLVEGNVMDTMGDYFSMYEHERIALLHFDMDVYEPTLAALELLWDRVVPGGLALVDDYAAVAGATQAVDDFLSGTGHGRCADEGRGSPLS